MTITECGMETSEREQAHAPKTGRCAPRLQAIPTAIVIPAKAGTYWRAPAYAKRRLPHRIAPRLQYPLPPRSRRPPAPPPSRGAMR